MKNKIYLLLPLFLFVIVSCGKETMTEVDEVLSKTNNRIYIVSNPSNAVIYVDQRNSGLRTPDSLKWLTDGKHTLTIKHKYFIDTTLTINVSGGTITNLIVDHYKNPGHMGNLSCLSNPENADIYIDDIPTNKKTPFTFNGLLPGEHKVKFVLPMHRADSLSLDVIGGDYKTAYLFLDDTTKGLYYTSLNSKIPSDYTYPIAVDSSNVKWIGTEGQGLIRFDGKNWSVFNTTNSSLSSNMVKCLFVDKTNRLWIGLDGGLFTFNGKTFVDYSSQLKNKFVTSIVEDKNGAIWIGSFGGLLKFDGNSWQSFSRNNSGLHNDLIYSLTVDKQNRIWASTNGDGIAVYNGTLWQKWDMANMGIGTRIGDVILSVICDQNGMIWAAHMREELQVGTIKSEGGLSRFDGTKWTIISVPQISTQYIISLNADRNNNKWVATKFGLGRFNNLNAASIFTKVNAKLQTSYINATALDRIGDLYVTTLGGGLSKFRKGSF